MDARILVILSLVAAAIAGPLSTQDSNKCSTQCTESSKFKYNPGTTYVYDYRVDTDSSVAGAFQDSAKTTIQTTVNIEVLSPCEFALQLSNTKLSHTDGKGTLKTCDKENQFRSEVEGSPLRFSFQDGVVEHICAEKDDSVRSLNLKKGILSAFQNGMDDLATGQNVTETDVVGTCKAEYKVVSNGYYTTEVKKVKDILTCTDRLDYKTMLQLTSYNVPSDLQNLPIMKTTHECEQTVEVGGYLKTAVCKESHVYRPFANGQSGAKTSVTQTLTYQTYRSGVSRRNGNVKSRSSLLFDHSANHLTKEQSRMSVEQKINTICDVTRLDITPETPRLFSELVAAMKGLDKPDLGELHRLLKTKSMCPTNDKAYKFFHDALPMLSTSASVGLMTELINDKDVTGLETTAWLTSLAFIQYPTTDMLLSAKTLLDNKAVRMDAMLPVSSMLNNFCKKMGTCNQDYAVINLMSSLERNIDYTCDASGKKFEMTLLTLKAIGNAGHAIRAIPVLNKCMTSTSNPLEIRVAAAEAFRRMPCADDDMSLWDTFADKDLDSELRINAYIALMRCPTQETLGKMAVLLNAEEDEQVGAFVYSHLTNLRETSDPHKQGVADAINNLVLDKEFDLSPLKFSRNFEVSALLNKINTGVTAEGNLIWSNKVQLPRAVSGNLTVQLFGQSVNLLDFGGRLEGLEYLIKNIFGPYVNSNEKPKMDTNNVKGSFYGRVFGNEMLFMHSQTTKSLFGDKTPTYLDMLIKMSNKQHLALTQSVQFMDICMVIPSSAGLPIHMNVNGTVTVDLNMSGKMDLRKAGASPRSLNVDGEIRPSAALEVTGSMFVDSFVSKTGLRMRNTLHTSTAVKGRIQMNRGQQLNVELDTPEEKMEIFNAQSNFVLLHDTVEQEQEMIKENRKQFKVCSGEQMTQITGMEMCGELSFPNASMKADSPYYPLTGPSSVSITLFKRDSHSGYKLFAKKVQNKKASMAQISINTPGSQVNRAMSVDMSLNYKKQNVEMNMATPWKKLAVNGNLINQKDLKSLSGSVVIDDKDTYAMTGEVKVSQSKSKLHVSPMIEFRRPGADNVQVTGFIAMEKPMKEVNMEMSLSGINKLPYTVKSSFKNTKKEKSVAASVSLDGKKEYSFKASNMMSIMGKKSVIAVIKNMLEVASPERRLMTLSNNVDYREDKSLKFDTSLYMYRVLKKPATLKVNLLKTARKKATNYKAVMNLKSSHVSGTIVCNVAKKPSGFMSVTSKVDYTIPRVSKNTINFNGKLNDRSTKSYTSYIVQSNMVVKKNPEYNSNMRVEVGHKKKLTYASMDLKYGANSKDKTKRIYLSTSLNKKVANMKNALISYKVKAQAPAINIDVLLQGKHQHTPKLLDSGVTLTYAPKKDINAGITVKDKSSKLKKVNGKAVVSWPGQEYEISTDLSQKNAKQYSNVLNFKSSSGTKHTISTVYKVPKSGTHDVVTSFRLHKMKPVSISGATTLNSKNFAASGEFKTGKDVYGFKTLSKFSKAQSAKMSLELIHPSRRVTLDVNGGKGRGKYEGKVEAAWDADNDKSQKMSLDGGYFHKSAKGAISLGGHANFRSPFEKFENLLSSVKYSSNPSQHAMNGKFLWGDKKDQIVSTITVKKPISLSNLHFDANIKTPFKGFRSADIDIAHKLSSDLNTVIEGKLEKENAKLTIQGQQLSNGYKGNMNMKSTIKNAENLALSASHTTEGDSCTNNAELNHNGKVYAYDLTMSHSVDGRQRKASGDLVLTMNKQKVATHWNHKNTAGSVKSSLNSKWNKNQLVVDLVGSHKLSNLRNINGVLKIKSPWKPVRDVEINLDHKHGSGLVNSVAFFKQGSNKKASSMINYNKGQNNADFDFVLASPFHEDLSGKLSSNYDKYPMTTNAELTWAPKMKGTLEGSLNLASWNNADLNMKMTTPSRTLRNVVFKASNKKENGETVSNLNLDYGMRQNIDVESRISNSDEKNMLRFKLSSPFKQLKSVNTGLNFNGNANKFDTTADFELLPSIGKFDGAMNWQNDEELKGTMRLNTPFPEYPRFVVKASNKKENGEIISKLNLDYGMKQNIDAESRVSNTDENKMLRFTLTSPFKQLKSVNTGLNFNGNSYKFDSAADFELLPSLGKFDGAMNWQYDDELNGKIRLDTPFPEYPYFELSTSSNVKGAARKSHIQAEYSPHQVYSLDTTYSFGSPLSFDAVVKSPFPEYNDIGMSLQHNMGDSSIKSQGEVKYQSDKKIEAELNADWKSDMEGNLLVKTPFRGYENNKISMRHRGDLDNFDTHGEVNVAEQNVVADASFKSGYTTTGTFTFSSPIPGLESIDVSLRKKGNKKNFKAGATINVNGDKIQTTLNNKMVKDSLKTNFNLMTPYIDAFKFVLDHSGPIEGFTNKINVNYGRKVDIDTMASFDLRGNDVNGKGVLKYKLDKGRNTARVSFSKNGPIEDVSFTTTASLNRDDITVSGSLRTKGDIDGSIEMKTPFKHFKNTGMTISHSGDITDFTSNANINYMNNKNINGKVQFSSTKGIKLTSEVTTPFKNFESTSVKVNHDITDFSGDISGSAEVTSTIGGFGTGDITYSKTGDLNDLVLKGSVSKNGKDMAVVKMTHNMQNSEVHSMCSLTSVATPDMYFSIDHSGDRFSFNTKTMGKIGQNTVSTDANMKRSYESISTDGSLTYKLQDQRRNKVSVTLKKDGPLDNCNMELTGKFNNDEVKLSTSRSGPLNDMRLSGSASYNRKSIDVTGMWKNTENIEGTLKLLTPFDNFNRVGLVFSHTGDSSDFATNFDVNYMDGKNINGKMELTAYNLNNVKFVSELTTPFKNFESLHMKFNNKYNTYTSELNGDAAIDTSIAGFGTGSVVYSKTGSLKNLEVTGNALKNGVEMAELKIKNNLQDKKLHSSFECKIIVTPRVMLTLDHNGDLTNLKTSARAVVGNKNIVYGEVTLNQRSNTVDAEGKLMYTITDFGNNQLSLNVHKEGNMNNFNVELTGKNGAKTSKITTNFKNENELTGDLVVNTPIEGYNNVGLSFKHSGSADRFNCEGKMVLTDGEEFSGKVDFYRHLLRRIETVIELNTPITNYEFTKFEYRHEGETDSCKCTSTLQYGNSQRVTFDMSANSSPKPTFTVTLKMPQEQFMATGSYENTWPRYSVNGKVNAGEGRSFSLDGSFDASTDFVGALTLSTPFEDFNDVGLSFRTSGFNSMGKITYMDGHDISGKGYIMFNTRGIETSLELTTPFSGYEFTKLENKYDADDNSLTSTSTLRYGNSQTITYDISVTSYPKHEFIVTLNIPQEQFMVSGSYENTWPKYSVIGKVDAGKGRSISLDGSLDASDEVVGALTLSTPWGDFNNVGLSFRHGGNNNGINSEGKIIYMDGQVVSGKVEATLNVKNGMEASVELTTPRDGYEFTKLDYKHEAGDNSLTNTATLQYGNSQRITYDLYVASSPKPQFTVTLKMSQEQIMASGSYENTWPRYSVNGKVDAGEGRSISLDGSLDASNDVVGALTLSTPFDDFNNVGLSFSHSPKSDGISTEGSITYKDGQVISGKAESTMRRSKSEASIELITPFSGYEFTRFETKHVHNRKTTTATTKLIYGDNKKIVVDAYKFKPTPEFSITITSPFSQDIEAFVSVDNTGPKYELTCKMTPGNGDSFTLDGTFDATQDISGSLKMSTPFDNFNKIGMNFMHSGNSEKFGTEGTLNYMDGQEIFGKVNFYRYMWRRIDASMELNTPFSGMETTKAEVNFEDNSNSISTTAALEYFNGKKLNGNVKITYSPNYDVLITLNTPFNGFNVIRAQGALDLTAPNYEALCSFSNGYNHVYSVNGKFNLYSAEHLDGSLEVNTPLVGFEYTKAEYEHKVDSSELEGSISLTYDDGKKMSCDVKSTFAPNFDGTVTVQTPFRGYENMQGSATFESSSKKYETSSTLNLGQGSIFSMTSELDYSIEPLKASTKISTPFTDFRNVELLLTHEGGVSNFKTTGFLSSPLTDHVNAKASLRYDAVMDMSAAASLQSSLEGFDDLKAELKTSDVVGEMKANALLGWTSGQQITYDSTFRKQDGWNKDKMHADISISTPFVAVRSLNLQMDHSAGSDSYDEKMNFELNGDSLVDFDAVYNYNDKKTAELIVRQPWPMQYTASKSSYDGTTDAEVFVNWNRDEDDSNVRVQAIVTDKSDDSNIDNALDLSVTYASRKVGVVHKMSQKSGQLLGNGHVYWNSDDDSKVSYEMQVNENNRRRKQIVDGSFKLGLPTRTLGWTGSMSQSPSLVSTDAAFNWDADRDDSKQIGVKTNLRLGDNLKGDVTLSMPSIRKTIRVDGEVMLANGRVLLDTKTDISYSKDSRKTLTLTSKLEDISTRNSHFNYSLALGIKHAFTNVDVSMNSHIGRSDEAMTVGIATNYLTSKRQMKNLALLSEINSLKKQISVQVYSPENSVEVVGDIVSETPYKLRLMNKINGQESFRSDMTIDTTKKAFTFNTFSDSDILTFAAKYPNSSAFQVDFSRHTPDFDQQEALMAVRLNTSRLLHTRLSWRPEMMEEFKEYLKPRALEKMESVIVGLTTLNEEFSEELSSKYSAITNEISQELQPFITALDKELALVAEKMKEFSDGLKTMYDNNDFYVQKMGDGVLKLQAKLERLTQEYTTTYTQLISSLKENLYEMRRFHIGAHYKHFVTQTAGLLVAESVQSMASLELYMAEVDLALQEYKAQMFAMKQKAMDTVYNATYVDFLSNKLNQAQNVDVSPYISSFDIPEQYTSVIYGIPSKFNAKLNDLLDGTDVEFVKEGLNEVYQQGAWAYNYWQLEENLEKHAKSILKTLKEIVEDELKEYSEDIKDLFNSPVTVWDPEHGDIQADIPLPIPVKRLDKLPEMKPIVAKVEKFANTYLPDQGTWDSLVESVSDMLPAKTESNKTGAGLNEQLTKYKPSKKYRKKGRKYKVKRSRQ